MFTNPRQLMNVYQNSSSIIGLQHLRQAEVGVGVGEAGGDEGQHGEEGAQPHPGHPRTLLVGQYSALLHAACCQLPAQMGETGSWVCKDSVKVKHIQLLLCIS